MPEGQKGELKMKKSFVFVYSDGTEEVVEYDSSMYTEDDVRTIYSNMDKFYSSLLWAIESNDKPTPELTLTSIQAADKSGGLCGC